MRMLPTSAVLAVLLSASSFVSAHFAITYPYWRGDSYPTQWTYPCDLPYPLSFPNSTQT